MIPGGLQYLEKPVLIGLKSNFSEKAIKISHLFWHLAVLLNQVGDFSNFAAFFKSLNFT